jgi:hypothetical protein
LTVPLCCSVRVGELVEEDGLGGEGESAVGEDASEQARASTALSPVTAAVPVRE